MLQRISELYMASLGNFLSIIIISLFIGSINYWSVNFPNADDYTAILLPLIEYTKSSSLSPFFEPHTQHYQILLRLTAWLTTLVYGAVNFKLLIFLGSLFIVPLIFLLDRSEKTASPWRRCMISALLCQPVYVEATQWGTNAIPYLWVNVFALAAFILAEKQSAASFSVAVLAALFSALSWGNGLLVLLCLFLLPESWSRLRLTVLSVITAAAFYLYFSNPALSSNHNLLSKLPALLLYQLQTIGSAFGFLSYSFSLAVGILLMLCWIVFILRDYKLGGVSQLLTPLFLFELYLLGSAMLCAIFRLSEGGDSAYSTGRYTLVSILFCICIFLRLEKFAELRMALRVTALGWLVFAYATYYNGYILRQQLLTDSLLRWSCFRSGLAGMGWENTLDIHSQAESLGLINIPGTMVCDANFKEPSAAAADGGVSTDAVIELEYFLQKNKLLHLAGYAFRPEDSRWSGKYELILKSDLNRFHVPLELRIRPDVSAHICRLSVNRSFKTVELDRTGFSGFITLEEIPPGVYDLFIGIENGGEKFWASLKRSIMILSST